MPVQSPEPYWIDELRRKHESNIYGDADARATTIEYEGRSLRLLMPDYTPPTAVRVVASSGDLLFIVGEQLDKVGEGGVVIEGGDGVVMVARRHAERDGTYWVFVCHSLFPES